MSYTATSTARVTLQTNFGSHAKVLRVFAWCRNTGRVSVLLEGFSGERNIDTIPESELEAVDAGGRYVTLSGVLKNRAELVLS